MFPVTRPTFIFFADPNLFFAGWGTFGHFQFRPSIVVRNFVVRNFPLPTSNRSSAISVYRYTTRGALLLEQGSVVYCSTTIMAAAIVSVNLTTNVRIFSGIKCLNSFPHPLSVQHICLRYHPAPQKGTAMSVYGQSVDSKVSRHRSLIPTQLILDS